MEQMIAQQTSTIASFLAVSMLAAPVSAATQPPHHDGARNTVRGALTNACAPWVDRQLTQLRSFQHEWETFNADPLQLKTMSQLRALLANSHRPDGLAGHLVPGADGSLQAEWHLKDASIGLLVEDDGSYSCWVRFNDTGQQFEEYGAAALPFFQALANQYRLNV
ncbi:MAG: hypothetical protein RL367_2621 [Pseudomonadota bacterium]